MLLKHLTQGCPDVKNVYMDFGCRMATAWMWYKEVSIRVGQLVGESCCFRLVALVFAQLAWHAAPGRVTTTLEGTLSLRKQLCSYVQALGEELPPTAHHVVLMVNWMHAASHDMACQLRNNGRFQQGTGWVVGEQVEQLWAMVKVRSRTKIYWG